MGRGAVMEGWNDFKKELAEELKKVKDKEGVDKETLELMEHMLQHTRIKVREE